MDAKLMISQRKRNTKNVILTIAVALGISATAIVVIYSSDTYSTSSTRNIAVPETSTGSSGCNISESYQDIFGLTIPTTQFSANWTFSWNTGNLVTHYSPEWQATSADWDVLGWVHLDTPHWAETNTNTWVAYGNGQYHVGLWYLSITQNIYSQLNVGPNPYGSASPSGGYGTAS